MHNLNKYWKWDGGYEYPDGFKVGGVYRNRRRDESDPLYDHYILVENVYGDMEEIREPNTIRMRRIKVSDKGNIYPYYAVTVHISCLDGTWWFTEDDDKVCSKDELTDNELADKIRLWMNKGVRKMDFNDMVKSIRKGRRPSKMKIFGMELPISYSSYGGNIQFQPEGYGGLWMQYQMCNIREFWRNYDEGEGQDPDNMTYIIYWDGTTWSSLDDDEPKRYNIRSAVISTGWGFICYNCTPTSYEDEYGETFYDIEMN